MMSVNHSQRYQARIVSKEWQILKERLIARAGHRCQRCKRTGLTLQLHHKTYDRLGHERDSDLEVLCITCHAKADKEREVRVANSAYNARLDGWARKVYGDDWEERWLGDYDRIEEEFEAWLETKWRDEY